MNLFECSCGATLFFHNASCVTCQREVGFCPACRRMTGLEPQEEGEFQCGHADCRARVAKCENFSTHGVCNWCVSVEETAEQPLCLSCRLTRVIPDLSVPGNERRWADLEQAKRRLLYTLDLIGLSYDEQQGRLPLSFEFKGDPIDTQLWHGVAGGGQVYTGHDNGVVTINIREADSVERELARVKLGEDIRTLIGHFRHEIGHYYWQRLIAGMREGAFIARFGDHRTPSYAEAKDQYYQNGPPSNWRDRFVTAYASMHPWEDFAESFAAYLDVIAMVDTAGNVGLTEPVDLSAEISKLIDVYRRLGVGINELNREMGLLDPVPFVLSAAVIEKLDFIHQLVHG